MTCFSFCKVRLHVYCGKCLIYLSEHGLGSDSSKGFFLTTLTVLRAAGCSCGITESSCRTAAEKYSWGQVGTRTYAWDAWEIQLPTLKKSLSMCESIPFTQWGFSEMRTCGPVSRDAAWLFWDLCLSNSSSQLGAAVWEWDLHPIHGMQDVCPFMRISCKVSVLLCLRSVQ